MKSASKLTHLDSAGKATMVDVGHKPVTPRQAVAEGFITLAADTIRAMLGDDTVALLSGLVMSVSACCPPWLSKVLAKLIPVPPVSISVEFHQRAERGFHRIRVRVVAVVDELEAVNGFDLQTRFR